MSRPRDDRSEDSVDDLDANAEIWGVEGVLAALAERDASPPPAVVRQRVLARAGRSPRALVEPAAPTEVYAEQVEALRALLDELLPADWARPAMPYDWTVHGLVAHLVVIESYTASVFGLGDPPPGDTADHLGLGADVIAAELTGPPGDTAGRWAAVARTVVEHVRSDAFRPDGPAPLHGWPFDAAAALVVRSFELWTHADDIRRAVGRPLASPTPPALRTMSSLSVRALPLVLPLATPTRTMAPTRVVLTGPGGGTYDLGGPGPRQALIAADVVDYCRVASRRLDPAELDCTVEGDDDLVRDLLVASRAFAM